MISYLNNPIGFYGSSNDQYTLSAISSVRNWKSNNNKERIGAYISMVKEAVKAETGQENSQTINNIYVMLNEAKTTKDIAGVYQALRSYTIVTNATKTKDAIANGDALDFYCKFENPNDKQYCTPFKSSEVSNGSEQQKVNYTNYYFIVGLLLLGGLGYYYRKDLKKWSESL